MIPLFNFFLQVNDPLSPVIGEIEDGGNQGIKILVLLIKVACVVVLIISAYKAFFGESKSGITSFFIVMAMVSIVFAIAHVFGVTT